MSSNSEEDFVLRLSEDEHDVPGKKSLQGKAQRECSSCKRVLAIRTRKCPSCGNVFPKRKIQVRKLASTTDFGRKYKTMKKHADELHLSDKWDIVIIKCKKHTGQQGQSYECYGTEGIGKEIADGIAPDFEKLFKTKNFGSKKATEATAVVEQNTDGAERATDETTRTSS
ncbi:unnamed protein product [Owenia fusiformis]|uniref:Uncharacterized protein n=1 Tax=Owenia fusiformis TaxID=6347 RepID=A0A8J1TCV7_OWEFU|nr:unnamed protein product [Owenia fusiformis]